MIGTGTYIKRETGMSMAINTALSGVAFVIAFGVGHRVPVWGAGHYVLDFVPQAFMIALMATLVPGALARRALRAGRVAPWAGRSALPHGLWRRAILLALASAVGAVGAAAAVLAGVGATDLPYAPALAAKLVFGAGLAALVTPPGLRAALSTTR